MLTQKSNKSNKVLCTCLKCCKKDITGLLVSKSTRTRHRKYEHEKPPVSDSTLSSSSTTVSNLSLSDIDSSTKSESFGQVKSLNNIICYNYEGKRIK